MRDKSFGISKDLARHVTINLRGSEHQQHLKKIMDSSA